MQSAYLRCKDGECVGKVTAHHAIPGSEVSPPRSLRFLLHSRPCHYIPVVAFAPAF
jgi:hypothetical protein